MKLLSLLTALYIICLAVMIFKIPQDVWDSYIKFEGSGRGMKIDSDGNLVTYKYKTTEDAKRLLHGVKQ